MNVLILSESFIVRDSLDRLFKNIYENLNIQIVTNPKNLQNEYLCNLDLAFLDVNEENKDVVMNFLKIREINDKVKLMVLDLRKDISIFSQMIKFGVDGYILNISDEKEFEYILKKILSGKKFYDSELLQYNINKENNSNTGQISLTNREKSVLSQVCKGLSNKDIAKNLNVTDYTIKKHVSSILNKLNLKNRQDIIIYSQDKQFLNEIG